MKLQLVKYRCAKCAGEFKAPEIAAHTYGEFLLRSAGNAEEAYLDAIEDETFQEVNSLLKTNKRVMAVRSNVLADILRRTYGAIACDPDSAGTPFQIGGFPKCPLCGSREMEGWEVTEPPEFVENALRPVSHAGWGALSDAEKKEKVDEVLSLIGY